MKSIQSLRKLSLFCLLVFTCHAAYPWWSNNESGHSDISPPYHEEPTCDFKSYEDPGLADAARLSDEKALRLLLTVSVATTKNPNIDSVLYKQLKIDLAKYSPAANSSLSFANTLDNLAPVTSAMGLVGAIFLVVSGSTKNAATVAWTAGGGVVAGIGSSLVGQSIAGSAEYYFDKAAREHAQGEVAEALKKEGAGLQLSPEFSLLADALGWNTSQRQTFIDAYVNLAASQYKVPEARVKDRGFQITVGGTWSSGHSSDRFTVERDSEISSRDDHGVTQEDVLKLIESNGLASDDQIKGIRNLNSGLAELSRIRKSANDTQDLAENHSEKSDPCAKEVQRDSEKVTANLKWMRALNSTLGKVGSDPLIHADPKAGASVASLQEELSQSISEVEKLEKVAARFAKLSK